MENFNMLWVDLETTGAEVDKHVILEVGAIYTDYDLNVLGTFTQATGTPGDLDLIDSEIVRKMHTENGLIDEINQGNGVSIQAAEERLVAKLVHLGMNPDKTNQIVLAGSGVGHFDKAFISKYMPVLSGYLKYFVIDVGVVRRTMAIMGYQNLMMQGFSKNHRALDDIKLHLQEMKTLKSNLDTIFGHFPYDSLVKEHDNSLQEGESI